MTRAVAIYARELLFVRWNYARDIRYYAAGGYIRTVKWSEAMIARATAACKRVFGLRYINCQPRIFDEARIRIRMILGWEKNLEDEFLKWIYLPMISTLSEEFFYQSYKVFIVR